MAYHFNGTVTSIASSFHLGYFDQVLTGVIEATAAEKIVGAVANYYQYSSTDAIVRALGVGVVLHLIRLSI